MRQIAAVDHPAPGGPPIIAPIRQQSIVQLRNVVKTFETAAGSFQTLRGVADAESRATAAVRIQLEDGSWGNLNLMAIPEFGASGIDRVLPESGAWPPAAGEVLIERASLADAGVAIGDEIVIETPDGVQHTLGVSGTAYDPGQVAPMFAEDQLSGYITLDTLAIIGQPAALNEPHIVAADNPRNLEQGEWVAGLARDQVLAPAGIDVHRTAFHDTPRYTARTWATPCCSSLA
jgi:hypothetical protein